MVGWLRRLQSAMLCTVLATVGMAGRCSPPTPMSEAEMATLYATPPAPSEHPLRVYHLGHSLVGTDMPAMLAQLAEAAFGPGHAYESQLGWGTPLKAHWEPDVAINGFTEMNDHARFRPALEAIGSGDYDAVVLTEMVEIKAAIEYHESWDYLARWAARAEVANPTTRVYLYETWHNLDDPEGWLDRLDRDAARYWEGEILARALNAEKVTRPIYLIPAGTVLAAFVRALETQNGLDEFESREALFARLPDGARDTIHIGDLGAYLVALTHFAVLYGRSPVGLPYALARADGSPAEVPSLKTAQLMQDIVWQVVTNEQKTGVRVP